MEQENQFLRNEFDDANQVRINLETALVPELRHQLELLNQDNFTLQRKYQDLEIKN